MFPTIYDFGIINLFGFSFPLAIHSFGFMLVVAFYTTYFILNNDLDSLFIGFTPDPTLQFTINDIFTGSISGGRIQATEYRTGVVFQINITDGGSGFRVGDKFFVKDSTTSIPVQVTKEVPVRKCVTVQVEVPCDSCNDGCCGDSCNSCDSCDSCDSGCNDSCNKGCRRKGCLRRRCR